MRTRVNRLRWAVLVLVLVVVLGVTAGFGYLSRVSQRQSIQTQLAVTCTSAKSDIEQLNALNEIADQLGIPHEFTVPRLPAECAP